MTYAHARARFSFIEPKEADIRSLKECGVYIQGVGG